MNTIEKTALAAVRYFAKSTGLLCYNRKFIVMDTLSSSLNISLVTADNGSYACQACKTVASLGIGPYTRVIAEKIVSTVNMNAHIIDPGNAEEIQNEIARHYALSAKVIAYMQKNPDKETLKMATVFACDPQNKQPVILSIPDVRSTASSYARQYAALANEFLASQSVRMLDIEKVILVGDTLCSPVVNPEISAIAESRLVSYKSSVAESFDYSEPAVQPLASSFIDDEATQFEVQPEPEPKPQRVFISQYREVMQLTIGSLETGTQVRLDTFDPTPGKGAAFQELEYIGNSTFRVTASGRTLAPGDIARPYDAAWHPGVQVDMEITRGPKALGRFRTRIVKRISVRNCHEDTLA